MPTRRLHSPVVNLSISSIGWECGGYRARWLVWNSALIAAYSEAHSLQAMIRNALSNSAYFAADQEINHDPSISAEKLLVVN